MSPRTTRFAPSPTGFLHLGHACSAIYAYDAAHQTHGTFILRIEDIDSTRCRPEFEAAIYTDLDWLGLDYVRPVRRQSEHFDDYAVALAQLDARGLLYPCFCTRAEIAAEIARSVDAPHGPEGALYPGTCRALSADEREARRTTGIPFALRLDIAAAMKLSGPLAFREEGDAPELPKGLVAADPALLGDVVLARKETPASYHLAVVVDDALQGVTHVTRGADLFHATHVQRLLQTLLGLPEPVYRHHRLVLDAAGKRLAKRDGAESLRALRERGVTVRDIRKRLGFA